MGRMSTAERETSIIDIEKNLHAETEPGGEEGCSTPTSDARVEGKSWWQRIILSGGVEVRGITPIPAELRTDTRFINIFSLWFTMSVSLLP